MRIDAVVVPPLKNDRLSRLYPAGLILEQLLDEGIAAPVIISRVLLAEPPSRWKSFGASSSLLLMLLLNVFLLPLLFPDRFEPVRHYLAIALAKPAEAPPKFARRVTAPLRAKIVTASLVETVETAPAPKIYMPTAEPIIRPITSHKSQPTPQMVEVASPIESPPPVTVASLEIPSLTRPREGVHTGIFGANDESGSSNSGNESHGHSRVVNAGFSNGTGGSANGNGRGLIQGEFADGHPPASKPKPNRAPTPPIPMTAVKILAKPTPLYTPEARSKKIEGEVVLKVIFQATGNVQVLTVVKGLGFGLDESAQNAARRIQFEPAKQGGQPIDFAAVVHINFQLAE